MKLDPYSYSGKSLSGWRGASIKTRIETPYQRQRTQITLVVGEEHPLKQGLKRNSFCTSSIAVPVEEEHPLKQGLKLDSKDIQDDIKQVEEGHPLKQGLKQCYIGETR